MNIKQKIINNEISMLLWLAVAFCFTSIFMGDQFNEYGTIISKTLYPYNLLADANIDLNKGYFFCYLITFERLLIFFILLVKGNKSFSPPVFGNLTAYMAANYFAVPYLIVISIRLDTFFMFYFDISYGALLFLMIIGCFFYTRMFLPLSTAMDE